MSIDHGHPLGTVDQDVLDGQSAYDKRALTFYDLLVYRGSSPLFWRCSPRNFLRMYDTCVGAEHVEIGVGTGYLLDHCRFPVSDPRITLVDLNPATLDFTAKRLAKFRTTQVRANALEPLPLPKASHDSVALSFLLHCIPGSIREKGVALAHAAEVVRPGGVVFGSTILSSGVPVTRAGRSLMAKLNAKGVFHNQQDSLDDLRDQLTKHFVSHDLVVRGCVGLFRARTAR
ncbi:class I SAM-dependent methyltransferase [Streptomyces sp. LX-29]|uniref:class I SAM-dependent methyltransferase n=1 Tax=Streptomyces sp. LX-29 TaxID=2900152 RepID=UPI00240DD50A|nr:class I SAM-dependent methyltransferase [Streptomyces sp. LX-29]WFB10708.1 class I SAM-dependent methyltransferase [Streptomyces sp. LX-29]